MSKYPTVITAETLEINAHISDALIAQDIVDTQAEVTQLESEMEGYALIAKAQIGTATGKMAAFWREGKQIWIEELCEFIQFLEALQAKRVSTKASGEKEEGEQ